MTQGERIREVRKTLGLTLEKFGEKIGMKKNWRCKNVQSRGVESVHTTII